MTRWSWYVGDGDMTVSPSINCASVPSGNASN
jgi:hypothetical protein